MSKDVRNVTFSRVEDDNFFSTETLSMDNAGMSEIKVQTLIESGSPISFVKESLLPRECSSSARPILQH